MVHFFNSVCFSILLFSFHSVLYTEKILIVCKAGHLSLNCSELCFYPWKCFVCSVALANICSNWQAYRCSVLVCLKVDRCASHWQRRGRKMFSTAGVMWVHSLVQLVCLHQVSRNSLIIQRIIKFHSPWKGGRCQGWDISQSQQLIKLWELCMGL